MVEDGELYNSRRSVKEETRKLENRSKPTEIMDRPNSVDYLPSIPEMRSGRRRASPAQRYNENFPGRREKNSDRVGRDYDKEANFSTGGVGSLTASRGSMHNFS